MINVVLDPRFSLVDALLAAPTGAAELRPLQRAPPQATSQKTTTHARAELLRLPRRPPTCRLRSCQLGCHAGQDAPSRLGPLQLVRLGAPQPLLKLARQVARSSSSKAAERSSHHTRVIRASATRRAAIGRHRPRCCEAGFSRRLIWAQPAASLDRFV